MWLPRSEIFSSSPLPTKETLQIYYLAFKTFLQSVPTNLSKLIYYMLSLPGPSSG